MKTLHVCELFELAGLYITTKRPKKRVRSGAVVSCVLSSMSRGRSTPVLPHTRVRPLGGSGAASPPSRVRPLGGSGAASPPDVRQGCALPSTPTDFEEGSAPGSGSALHPLGQRPEPWAKPQTL